MSSIPEEVVEQIRSHADILDVIGEYVNLKQRGRNFIGLCPFHSEKTPSFTVSPDKGIYKCFGCGKAGNSISFVMEYSKISYVEALESLARKYGINLNKNPSAETYKHSRTATVLNALKAAADYYSEVLMKSNAGANARKYFQKRAFSRDTAMKFAIGYSLEEWDALIKHLSGKGFTIDILNDAGLVVKKDNGHTFDRFRGRAMFPIKDFLGRVVGFGARIMKDDKDQPKYLNSPQSLVYDKSKVLYGIYEARNSIITLKEAIMVEGYADVITLHQAGFTTAVASSGTALTPSQLKLLAKYAKRIFFVYDADTAGIKATDKGLELALEQGFDVRIVRLPKGEDPDSMIRTQGELRFRYFLENATNFVEFKLMQFKNAGMIDSPGGKADAVRELVRLVALIPDKLQHDFFMRQIAGKLELSEAQMTRIYTDKELFTRKSFDEEPPVHEYIPHHDSDYIPPPEEDEVVISVKEIIASMTIAEISILKVALSGKEQAMFLFNNKKITDDIFYSDTARRLYAVVMKKHSAENLIGEITSDESISRYDKETLIDIAIEVDKPSDNWEKFGAEIPEPEYKKEVEDALLKLSLDKVNAKIENIQKHLRDEPHSDIPNDILVELKDLNFEKNKLTKMIFRSER